MIKQDKAEFCLQMLTITSIAVATMKSPLGMWDCTVGSDVGTGDFSLVHGILYVCGHAQVPLHVSPGIDCPRKLFLIILLRLSKVTHLNCKRANCVDLCIRNDSVFQPCCLSQFASKRSRERAVLSSCLGDEYHINPAQNNVCTRIEYQNTL